MQKVVTGDYRLVKNLNNQLVLNLIRTNHQISGAALAKITRMRPSTIMNILKNLENKGLIVKAGTGNSTVQGGRRPILWEICGNYGYIIGIKIELNEIYGVLMDLNSQILAEAAVELTQMPNISGVEEKILGIINQLIIQQKISRKNLLGLGVGVSGAVDHVNGVIIKTDLIKENPVPLKAILEKHFDCPVFIENDANAAVMCEKWFGKAKDRSNIVYMLLVVDWQVSGIGYGLILDNRIYRGAHMFAGETSPDIVQLGPIHDFCEQHGAVPAKNQKNAGINALLDAVGQQNEPALACIREIGVVLGRELARIVDLLDPEMVILGGALTRAGDALLNVVRETISRESNLNVRRDVAVELASTADDHVVALGAATLILQSIFHHPMIKNRNDLS